MPFSVPPCLIIRLFDYHPDHADTDVGLDTRENNIKPKGVKYISNSMIVLLFYDSGTLIMYATDHCKIA